jgi:hypothetical protein
MLKLFTRKALLGSAIAVSALTLPLVSLLAQSALADKSNFQIINETNLVITELYLSDSSLDNWNNDILDTDTLDSGDSIRVNFADMSNDRCLYDVRAVFSDGQAVEDFRLNVCEHDNYKFFNQ